jgi:hypothetical protein
MSSIVSKLNDDLDDPDVRVHIEREDVDITDVGSGDYVQFQEDRAIYRARWRQTEAGPFVLEFTNDGEEFERLKDVHAGTIRECLRVTSVETENWTLEP